MYLFVKELNYASCYFWTAPKEIDRLLKGLPSNEKVIYFCNKEKGESLHKEYSTNSINIYEDSPIVLGTKSLKTYKANKSQKDIERINTLNAIEARQPFNAQILFTTNILAYGVEFIDPYIMHIICDTFDLDILCQYIGRRRISPGNSRPNLYIRDRTDITQQKKWASDRLDCVVNKNGVE